MNTETMDKVAEIIGSLCEKLGTTAQYLIPEMAKMHTANSLFWMIAWIVIFIVALIILPFSYKAKQENDDSDTFAILLVLNVLVILVVLVCGLCCASDLIKWNASPTAMAITTLLNKVALLKN
jgi:Na+-driven multidrug efflux pump